MAYCFPLLLCRLSHAPGVDVREGKPLFASFMPPLPEAASQPQRIRPHKLLSLFWCRLVSCDSPSPSVDAGEAAEDDFEVSTCSGVLDTLQLRTYDCTHAALRVRLRTRLQVDFYLLQDRLLLDVAQLKKLAADIESIPSPPTTVPSIAQPAFDDTGPFCFSSSDAFAFSSASRSTWLTGRPSVHWFVWDSVVCWLLPTISHVMPASREVRSPHQEHWQYQQFQRQQLWWLFGGCL